MSSFISGLWWISPGWVTNGLFLGSVLYEALSSCFSELFLHFDSLWSTSAPSQSTWTPTQRAISWTHTVTPHKMSYWEMLVSSFAQTNTPSHHTLQCLPGVSGVNSLFLEELYPTHSISSSGCSVCDFLLSIPPPPHGFLKTAHSFHICINSPACFHERCVVILHSTDGGPCMQCKKCILSWRGQATDERVTPNVTKSLII